MSLKPGIKRIIGVPFTIIHFFKNSKLDNFVGGLIFGAVFSLVVNICTVYIQEFIDKQRTLEALEREVITNYVMGNQVEKAVLEYQKQQEINPSERIYPDLVMRFRFNTNVWDSQQAMNYLFELDPEVSSKLQMHYEYGPKAINYYLSENQKNFQEAFKKCEVTYPLVHGENQEEVERCNELALIFAHLHAQFVTSTLDQIQEINKQFHPTKDRLNNIILRNLLGNKSVEILR